MKCRDFDQLHKRSYHYQVNDNYKMKAQIISPLSHSVVAAFIILSCSKVDSALPEAAEAGICDQVCTYNRKNQNADCRNVNLVTVPEASGKCGLARHVDMSSNMITEIHPGDFKGYTAVKVLLLGKNQIHKLPTNMLANSTLLTQLQLNNNLLTNLTNRAFSKLAILTQLYLDYNAIDILQPDAFYGLFRLGQLFMLHNMITILPEGVFKYLRALNTLSLSDNMITQINAGAFTGLTQLKRLDLSSNKITAVEVGSFQRLDKLVLISLEDNGLLHVSISAFMGLPLQNLKLSQNNISSFDNLDAFLDQATSLKEFASSDNPLICDCSIEPLAYWYRLHDPQQNAACNSPEELKGVRLVNYDEPPCTLIVTSASPQDNGTLMLKNPNTRSGNKESETWSIISIVFVSVIILIIVVGLGILAFKRRGKRHCFWNRASTDLPRMSITSGTGLMVASSDPSDPPRMSPSTYSPRMRITSTTGLISENTGHQYEKPDPARSTSSQSNGNRQGNDSSELPGQIAGYIDQSNTWPDSVALPSALNAESEPLYSTTIGCQTANKDKSVNDTMFQQEQSLLRENTRPESPYLPHSVETFPRKTNVNYHPI